MMATFVVELNDGDFCRRIKGCRLLPYFSAKKQNNILQLWL